MFPFPFGMAMAPPGMPPGMGMGMPPVVIMGAAMVPDAQATTGNYQSMATFMAAGAAERYAPATHGPKYYSGRHRVRGARHQHEVGAIRDTARRPMGYPS